MTAITRDLLRALRDDVNAALVAVAKKHGVALSCENASFTSSSATFKLLAVSADENASGRKASHVKAENDMRSLGKLYQADPAWIGQRFTVRNTTFTVVGLLPGRSKNCILAPNDAGKDYIWPVEDIKRHMAA